LSRYSLSLGSKQVKQSKFGQTRGVKNTNIDIFGFLFKFGLHDCKDWIGRL